MIKKEHVIALLINLALCLGIVFAVQAIEIIDFQQHDSKESIVIYVPAAERGKAFTLPNPNRLVVDVPSVAVKYKVSLPEDYAGKLIKSARFGQFSPQTSRFVFDLNQAVKISSIRKEPDQLLVEITANIASERHKTAKKPQSVDVSGYKNKKWDQPPLIVIDAGHGGVDPGTIGEAGTQEKDVVLRYAKELKSKLLKLKKYRVILTRSEDEFIMLRKRVAIARKADANLFISLHADSADEPTARGLSVYTVSEQASDKEAEALAARENKSDIIGGMDLSNERSDVADILISLAQRETKNNSALLADFLVSNLTNKVRILPNPHRFAGFAVLKAPDIPSVLVEIGFLSHPQEEKEIKTKEYRNRVTDGITAGINAYFRRKSAI